LDGCLLDAHFTRLVYKRILDKPVTYHDMASVDVQFYKSLCWLLENKLEGMDLSLTFSVDKENFGAYEEVELKEKGKEMVVTEQNKREYVDLLASWRLKGATSMLCISFSSAYEIPLCNLFICVAFSIVRSLSGCSRLVVIM
jgi:hypothetical protein